MTAKGVSMTGVVALRSAEIPRDDSSTDARTIKATITYDRPNTVAAMTQADCDSSARIM
jgi:hypothetical protein